MLRGVSVQVPSERVRRVEEERDKLARENKALFERLEESRARQRRMTQDQETQARAIHSSREVQTQTASRGNGERNVCGDVPLS